MWMEVIYAVLSLSIIGTLLGGLLAYVAGVFTVTVNEKIVSISEVLPGVNCGGCGYAGCGAYAKGIVENDASTGLCAAISDDEIKKIANIVGVDADKADRKRAMVMCFGGDEKTKKKYKYIGISDCDTVNKLGGGSKKCVHACLGLGDCVKKCKFDAIKLENGIAVIDAKLCRMCGVCISSCPKGIIKSIPYKVGYYVQCSSKDKGIVTRANCEIGCIACKLCEKACRYGAITVNDNSASINYDLCKYCGECATACPRKIIRTGFLGKDEHI